MKSKYVSVIGSLNYDFIMKVNRAPKLGETLTASNTRFSCGGKGANQAYQMGNLGLNVFMIGCVGNDYYGEESIASLKLANVKTDSIVIKNTNTGLGFVTALENGEVTAIIDQGANALLDKKIIDENYNLIFNSEWIVLQFEIPMETTEYVINEAYKNGVGIILNPAPTQDISQELLKKIDYLIVNEVEASYYLGYEINEFNLNEKIFNLRNKVKSGLVLTLGSKGSYYIDDKIYYIPIIKANAVDTTGAGDSYIGAFVYGLCQGLTPMESCHLGAYSSAKTVEDYGRKSMPKNVK